MSCGSCGGMSSPKVVRTSSIAFVPQSISRSGFKEDTAQISPRSTKKIIESQSVVVLKSKARSNNQKLCLLCGAPLINELYGASAKVRYRCSKCHKIFVV